MEKYRVAYVIDGNLKFKNINAKNEKCLKNKLEKNYFRIKSFYLVYCKKIYDFRYGLFNDMTRRFERDIVGETPQEVMKKAFRALGDNARKIRYRVKPLDLSKKEQDNYNLKIKEFDKNVMEVLKK